MFRECLGMTFVLLSGLLRHEEAIAPATESTASRSGRVREWVVKGAELRPRPDVYIEGLAEPLVQDRDLHTVGGPAPDERDPEPVARPARELLPVVVCD